MTFTYPYDIKFLTRTTKKSFKGIEREDNLMIENVHGYFEEVRVKHQKLRRLAKERHLKYLEEKSAYSIAYEELLEAQEKYQEALMNLKDVEDIYNESEQRILIKRQELENLKVKGRGSREDIAQVVCQIRLLHHEIDRLEYEAFLKQNLIGFKRAELNMAEAMKNEKQLALNKIEEGLKHRRKDKIQKRVEKLQNVSFLNSGMLNNA